MARFLIFFILLIGLTLIMWENIEQKASIRILGHKLFSDIPVLLIILTSMLLGMLFMFPFIWMNQHRLKRKLTGKETKSNPKQGTDAAKTTAVSASPRKRSANKDNAAQTS